MHTAPRDRRSSVRTKAALLVAAIAAQALLSAGASAAVAGAGRDVFAPGMAQRLAALARRQAEEQQVRAVARAAAQAAADAQRTALRQLARRERERAASRKARRAHRLRRAQGLWVRPVPGAYVLSAGFGMAGGHWAHRHSGQDFAVPVGTPVQAVHDGTVVKAGPGGAGDGGAYGNAVVVRHSAGTYSQYAHLSAVLVHVGQQVRTGQRIARSGDTGNSTGPHLHFEIRRTPDYGSGEEPLRVLRQHGVIV